METYPEPYQNEKEFEEEIEFTIIPERQDQLEKLTQTPLEVGDLVGENLEKLAKFLQNKEGASDIRLQIEGLAVTLTAYKLKKIQGERYIKSSRSVDAFIEVRCLSNLLKGINRTLESKRKTPQEISDILYSNVTELIRGDNISAKDRQALDRGRIYNLLAKRYFMKYDEEKIIENLIDIGKLFDTVKGGNIRKKIETELARYKKMPQESLKQVETIEVARAWHMRKRA